MRIPAKPGNLRTISIFGFSGLRDICHDFLTPFDTERNGRKTLTTVQGLPKKFDQKKILKVIKKKFGRSSLQKNSTATPPLMVAGTKACNGTIVNDTEMGEVIQLQGDQRKDVQEFLVDKKEGLELDAKTIKVQHRTFCSLTELLLNETGPWVLRPVNLAPANAIASPQRVSRSPFNNWLPSLLV
ncbi:Eukaryotic translation initiation factor eIF-1 [Lecanora helva]